MQYDTGRGLDFELMTNLKQCGLRAILKVKNCFSETFVSLVEFSYGNRFPG